MIDPRARQKIFYEIGETGCYMLSVIHLAEEVLGRYIDAYDTFLKAQATIVVVGHETKPVVDRDLTVWGAGELLTFLTGMNWKKEWSGASYVCKEGELEILQYYWEEEKKYHFICKDYDPYGNSATVVNGKPIAKRIFRRY
jgi:hypothetical protein